MKKLLIFPILGLAVSPTLSFGQGSIRFDSYNAGHGDIQTTYGAGVEGYMWGAGLTSGWTAGLLYSLTPISETATTSSAEAATSLNDIWSVAPITAVYRSPLTGYLPGYYVGNNFILPDGFDGQTLYFEVIAFQTDAPGADSAEQYANSTVRGHSAAFTGVLHTIPLTMDNMQPFSVFAVPEPSTLGILTLAGWFVGWRWRKVSRSASSSD